MASHVCKGHESTYDPEVCWPCELEKSQENLEALVEAARQAVQAVAAYAQGSSFARVRHATADVGEALKPFEDSR